MGLVLDEPRETDEKINLEGLTFLIDPALVRSAGTFRISLKDTGLVRGLQVTSTKSVTGRGCS